MMTFIAFLVLALLLCGIYAVVVMLEIPGLADERLGALEPLPPLDVWTLDTASSAGEAASSRGLVREVRVCVDHSGGLFRAQRYIEQARTRDPRTDEIVDVETDRVFRRRRLPRA